MIINSKFKIQNSKFKIFNFTFCILIFAFSNTTNAHAHKVSIYAYAEDGVIHSESYFVDGTRCKNSEIEVFDEKEGNKLLEGKTNKNGEFSFKIPKVTSLRLVLHASMGHQAEFTISEDEVREAMDIEKPSKSPTTKLPLKSKDNTALEIQKNKTGGVSELKGISESEMEAIFEGIVDRKLKPIERMLVKLQENSSKPGFTEIVGGIGYIIGILGIIAYFKAKRIKKN